MSKNVINTYMPPPLPVKQCPEFLQKYGLWIFKHHVNYTALPIKPQIFRHFNHYSLAHMLDGTGWLYIQDQKIEFLKPGDGILIGPGIRQGYGGYKDNYVEDSISFFGPVADQMAKAGLIKNGIVKLGKARKLLPIIELTQNPSLSSQYRANMALQELLLELFLQEQEAKAGNIYKNSMENLIKTIRKNVYYWWTVEEMATFCNLSLSQFRRNFQKYTGMRPKRFILEIKIKSALTELLTTDQKVYQVATKYGYKDAFHFSKSCKQVCGLSPQQYRDEFRI